MKQIIIMASVAIFDNDRLLVAKRSEHEQYLSGYWTGIGGKLEDDDISMAEAAIREAKEETGLDVEIVRPLIVREFMREDRPGQMTVEITYLVKLKAGAEFSSSEEHSELRWVTQEEAANLSPITEFGKENFNNIFTEYFKYKQ
jgi:8-oxo-dGTP diphosphatase